MEENFSVVPVDLKILTYGKLMQGFAEEGHNESRMPFIADSH
jgi:hypothetical protein